MKNTIKKIYHYGLWKSLQYLYSEVKYVIYYRLFLRSYSQRQEDLLIDKVIGGKKKGFYVDIGANDPVRFNNTFRFYQKGWRGINVEPNMRKYMKLNRVRPRDTNIYCGISGSQGKLSFYNFYTDTLSTFSKKEADNYVKQGFDIESIKNIDTIPMKDLFRKYKANKIDFLSVDTEGYDLIILQSNDWKKFRPKVICIENVTQNNTGGESQILRLLINNQYELVVNNVLNSIFRDAR